MKPKENQASNPAEGRWIIHPKYKDRSSFSIAEAAVKALRQALKLLLRRFGLRAIEVNEERETQ